MHISPILVLMAATLAVSAPMNSPLPQSPQPIPKPTPSAPIPELHKPPTIIPEPVSPIPEKRNASPVTNFPAPQKRQPDDDWPYHYFLTDTDRVRDPKPIETIELPTNPPDGGAPEAGTPGDGGAGDRGDKMIRRDLSLGPEKLAQRDRDGGLPTIEDCTEPTRPTDPKPDPPEPTILPIPSPDYKMPRSLPIPKRAELNIVIGSREAQDLSNGAKPDIYPSDEHPIPSTTPPATVKPGPKIVIGSREAQDFSLVATPDIRPPPYPVLPPTGKPDAPTTPAPPKIDARSPQTNLPTINPNSGPYIPTPHPEPLPPSLPARSALERPPTIIPDGSTGPTIPVYPPPVDPTEPVDPVSPEEPGTDIVV